MNLAEDELTLNAFSRRSHDDITTAPRVIHHRPVLVPVSVNGAARD